MKLKKSHLIGAIFSVIIVIVDFVLFFGDRIFLFLVGIGFVILVLPFLIGLMVESTKEKEKSERFLEFTRNLAESVKTGTPIGKSIVNMSSKDFGTLSPHIRKLANQIELGIPISKAFKNFASDVNNVVVSRAIGLIQEAENAGGDIDSILNSTAESMYQIEKLRHERKAAVSSLVVQGYVIFLIFVAIMLIMQFKILPLTAGIGGASIEDIGSTTALPTIPVDKLARPFLYLLLVQGFFAGLTIGKISEGTIKSGLKHSIILVLIAFLTTSGANAFL